MILSDSDARLAVINALLRDAATRKDIEDLRSDVDERAESLRTEIKSLDAEVASLAERVAMVEGSLEEMTKGSRIWIEESMP
jgi:chaperonin cofactor prefoldin